jgi:hypothetical protein
MIGDRHRYLRGVALASAAAMALGAAGCNRPGTPKPVTPTTSTTAAPGSGSGHDDGGMDHSMPDRLNHPPTAEQKAAALKWVDETRAAVKADGLTVEKLKAMHYINIGDGIHYVKPEYARDDLFLEPHHIESFAVFGGQIAAAMYVYNPKGANTKITDVPDIAGNWTEWHGHVLPYRSNDPNSDDFFRLGGPYTRSDSPMVHVWLQPNKCGPFASAGVGEGSCIKELATY